MFHQPGLLLSFTTMRPCVRLLRPGKSLIIHLTARIFDRPALLPHFYVTRYFYLAIRDR